MTTRDARHFRQALTGWLVGERDARRSAAPKAKGFALTSRAGVDYERTPVRARSGRG